MDTARERERERETEREGERKTKRNMREMQYALIYYTFTHIHSMLLTWQPSLFRHLVRIGTPLS